MAKKDDSKITRADLTAGIMTAEQFRALNGEKFAGLNILKLEPGTGGGPFTLTKILPKQDLGGGAGKGKRKPVDVYVAEDSAKVEVRMPIAASFTGKAKDAKLAIGDSFAVFRQDDYTSKKFGSKCASYEITVTGRAKK